MSIEDIRLIFHNNMSGSCSVSLSSFSSVTEFSQNKFHFQATIGERVKRKADRLVTQSFYRTASLEEGKFESGVQFEQKVEQEAAGMRR